MSFTPRLRFPFPSRTPTWFAGHMAKSLRQLPELLEEIDLVIEARDARLPLTSWNVAFEKAMVEGKGKGRAGAGRERLVVYTKRDLAEKRFEEPLRQAFATHADQKIMFADTRQDGDVRRVLRHAVGLARARTYEDDYKILVVGMPNVGKSSLLNALRRVGVGKGKAFRVGSEPGLTRKLTGTVRIHDSPALYVYDTPGVMMSYLGTGEGAVERAIKLGLTRGMRTDVAEDEATADYLLWRANLRDPTGGWMRNLGLNVIIGGGGTADDLQAESSNRSASSAISPTNDLHVLLDVLARRLGALGPGGEPDHEHAQRYFVRAFLEGKFGPWTLDDLEKSSSTSVDGSASAEEESKSVDATVAEFIAHQRIEMDGQGPSSRTQERKREKKRVAEERQKRWEGRNRQATKTSFTGKRVAK